MSRYDKIAKHYIIQNELRCVLYHDLKRYEKKCHKAGYIVYSYYPRRKAVVIYYIRVNDKSKLIGYSIFGSKNYTIKELEEFKEEMEREYLLC